MKIIRARSYSFTVNGFTLIELLVVVGIISLVASIVLVAINTSRNKGKLASVQANLNTVKSESELYYVGNDAYGPAVLVSSACNTINTIFAFPIINAAIEEATRNGEVGASSNRLCVIGVDGQSWAVSIPLSGGGDWCVGTSGTGGLGTAAGGGGVAAFCAPPGN